MHTVAGPELTREEVLSNYKDVFEGLGHIGTYHIELDSSVPSVQNQPPPARQDQTNDNSLENTNVYSGNAIQ